MNRQTLKHDLWLAEAHIAQGEENVAKQRSLIVELEANGHNTASAKDLLAELENAIRLHQADRDRFRKALASAE